MLKLDEDVRFLLRLMLPRRPGDQRPERPAGAFSWPKLERRAVDFGLGPLLHHRLREWEFESEVPVPIVRHLEEIRRCTAVRNAILLHHLARIDRWAAAAGIPFVLLKGGDFVQTLYPDRSLRVLLDLDLLLRKPDSDRLEAALPALGFATSLTMEPDWFEENLHHGLPWHGGGDGDGVTLEVHWSVTRPSDPFSIPVEELFAASETLTGAMRRLSPADSLEYLAVHVFRHLTTPDGAVRSIVDALLLLDGDDARRLDWGALRERSAARGTEVPLALLLSLAAELRPGGIPRSGEARPEFRELLEAMFRMPIRQPPAIVSGFTGLGQAAGLSGKIGFLKRGLIPDRRDLNRDLDRSQSGWPLPFKYVALLSRYAHELIRVGPGAARGAYRLGRLRRKLKEKPRPNSS